MNNIEASISTDVYGLNRSQCIFEIGYINGLGCSVAIVDRMGNNFIIPPSTSHHYAGKFIIARRQQMLSSGNINILSTVHQDPVMRKALEGNKRNKTIEFQFEITFDQLSDEGWYYDDRLDLLIAFYSNYLVMPQLPRIRLGDMVKSISSGSGGVMLSAKILGNWPKTKAYMAAGTLSVEIPIVHSEAEPVLVMTTTINNKVSIFKYTNMEEIREIVSDDPPVILVEQHLNAQKAILEKNAIASSEELAKLIAESLSGYKAVFESVSALLELHQRLEAVSSDRASDERKAANDFLKLTGNFVSAIKTVI